MVTPGWLQPIDSCSLNKIGGHDCLLLFLILNGSCLHHLLCGDQSVVLELTRRAGVARTPQEVFVIETKLRNGWFASRPPIAKLPRARGILPAAESPSRPYGGRCNRRRRERIPTRSARVHEAAAMTVGHQRERAVISENVSAASPPGGVGLTCSLPSSSRSQSCRPDCRSSARTYPGCSSPAASGSHVACRRRP